MAQCSTRSGITNPRDSNLALVAGDLDFPALGAQLFGGLRRAVLFDHVRVPRRADATVVLADISEVPASDCLANPISFAASHRCRRRITISARSLPGRAGCPLFARSARASAARGRR